MKTLLVLLVTLLLGIGPALAAPATWQIDPNHASVEFKVRHLMVAYVKGVFTKVDGIVDADDADLGQAKVSVSIETASIDTNNAKRDEHLRSPDFFDVGKFPLMTFVSKKIAADGGQLRQVVGDLTIRDVTREVTLEVAELSPPIKDPWGNLRRGATATATINRKDFGLTWNKVLETGGVAVGDEVKIALDVELIRK